MVKTAAHYLKENVDEQLTIKPWLKKNDFPIFLRDSYNFYEMTILGTRCILLEAVDEMPNVDQLQKHIKQIKNLADRQIVLFYKAITRYRRKSLIEDRIAFVIEDGQMYLPFLGLDLKKAKEHFEEEAKEFTEDVLASMKDFTPRAVVVDVGQIAEKGWAVVEANGAWGSGIYGCDPNLVLDVIQHATIQSERTGA